MRYRDEKGTRRSVHLHVQAQQRKAETPSGMTGNRLIFIGIASIVGAGFFLATATVYRTAGPSILLGYALAGLVIATVFNALGEMVVHEPGRDGSFRVYAEEHLGRGIAFVAGWMYWVAGVLIMSSEVTALGIFTQRWLPEVPLWILFAVYSVLALGINWLGASRFGRIESFFAVIKIAALIGFVLAVMLTAGGSLLEADRIPREVGGWFPHGVRGLWVSMTIVFFTFGGVAATGMATAEMKNVGVVPRSFRRLTGLLLLLYFLPLTLMVALGGRSLLSRAPLSPCWVPFTFPMPMCFSTG